MLKVPDLLINILESVSLKLFVNEVIFVGQAVKNEYIRAYGNNNKVLSSMIYFSIPSKFLLKKIMTMLTRFLI